MKKLSLFCAAPLVLMAFAMPAAADVTATYVADGPTGQTLTLEVSDDGEMRVSAKQGIYQGYTLFLGGQIYEVIPGPGGPKVMTLAAAAEQARRVREDSDRMMQELGIDFNQSSTEVPPQSFQFVAVGTKQIAGYEGIAYDLPGSSLQDPFQIVLSQDHRLLPLGQAFLAHSKAIEAQADPEMTNEDNLDLLFSTHGVLAYWQYRLTAVSFEPIDVNRFSLPSTPIDLADLDPHQPKDHPLEAPPEGPQPFVKRAEFFGDALLTLFSDGRLLSWYDGSDAGIEVSTPGTVLDFCTLGAKVLMVTGDPGGAFIQIWTGSLNDWSLLAQFPTEENDPFLALDCTGPDPLVLTARSIKIGDEIRPISLPGGGLGLGGNLTTLRADGLLFVGVNLGEWGGGLLRFPVTGGEGIYIDDSGSKTLCGGMLNKSCHPVTGLASDPANAKCVLASIGLNHMMSKGAVLRIWDKSISRAFTKPYTLDPKWKFDPSGSFEDIGTVAFQSLVGAKGGVWAVANDGTYHFTARAEPDFFPFPSNSQFNGQAVDWSNPEFVLVYTLMNARFSVGGGSLILVPRSRK